MIRIPEELSLSERQEYWKNYKLLTQYFPQDLVDEALLSLEVKEIVEEYALATVDVRGRRHYPSKPYGKCRLLGSEHRAYTYYNDEGWQKTLYVPCDIYLVAREYQSLSEPKIIRYCLLKDYPWLSEYRLNIYGMRCGEAIEEFYVDILENPKEPFGSLYVPYRAFLEGEPANIVKRNREYSRSYSKQAAEKMEEVLLHPTTQGFLDKVRISRTGASPRPEDLTCPVVSG